MNERPWWTHVLQWGAWGILMTVVMGWLAKTRNREPERLEDGGVMLRNPRSLLAIGLCCSLLFVAAAILAAVTAKPGTGVGTFLIFICFALLGGLLVADYYLDRHQVGSKGIQYRTTFGGSGSTSWEEVRRVRYSQSMKWFRLELSNGKVVRISAMMVGLPQLATLLLTQADHADVDKQTRQVLVEAENGNPPKIWM